MLDWRENNGKWYGYEDGALLYRVHETAEGWEYEYLPDCGDGMCGYDTAQEAIEAAEADFEYWQGRSETGTDDEPVVFFASICEGYMADDDGTISPEFAHRLRSGLWDDDEF